MDKLIKSIKNEISIIISNNEKLGLYALKYIADLVLKGEVKHIIIIKVEQQEEEYFKVLLSSDSISINPEKEEIKKYIDSYTIVSIGLSIISNEFGFLKDSKNSVIFFVENLGVFREGLINNYKNIQFIEKRFSEYIKSFIKIDISPEPYCITNAEAVFVNRKDEIGKIIDAFKTNSFRGIKILGMPGIGKKAIIKELKERREINENCFEFYFQDELDGLDDILDSLFALFGVDSNIGDYKYDLKSIQTKHLIKKFFSAFDMLIDGKIIFYNIHNICDKNSNTIIDSRISELFKLILSRQTYKGNKILFISDTNFKLDIDSELMLAEQTLKGLKAEHIKELMQNEFINRGYEKLANRIKEIEDEKLQKIVSGHPQISKLFVIVAENYGVDNLINDEILIKQFNEKHKANYLLSKIEISRDEYSMLGILSLFTENIDFIFIKNLKENPNILLESLINKFLLEKIVLDNGRMKYYVPSLIKDIIKSKTSKVTLNENHNKIGDYYWNIGEDLSRSGYDILDSYRKSFFHYTESKNSNKINLLSLRFKEKIIKKAISLFWERHIEESWNLFNELYEANNLNKPSHLVKYFEAEIIMNKKDEDTLSKITNAIKDNPIYDDLKVVYAKYLFSQGNFIGTKEICDEMIKESFPTENNKLNLIYLRTLPKIGLIDKSINYLVVLISKLEMNIKNISSSKYTLEALYVLFIDLELGRFEDNKTIAKNCIRNIENLGFDIQRLIRMIEGETEYTEEIISSFELAYLSSVKHFEMFIRYLAKKRRLFEINSFIEKSKLGLKIDEKNIECFDIEKWKEKADKDDNLLFYAQNKMSNTPNIIFKDNGELENYISALLDKTELLSITCKKLRSLDIQKNPVYIINHIEILEKLEILTNLKKILFLSQNREERLKQLESKPDNVVYVEGETDELYIKAAAKILEKNHFDISIKWIGNFDEKGNAQFTGDSALNHTFNYYQANPDLIEQNKKIILLYDSDTNKPPLNIGRLFVRKVDKINENKLFRKGIENLLILPIDFNSENFYTISTRIDDYGAESKVSKLDKMKLCNWICNEENMPIKRQYFANFHLIFEKIEDIINGN